MPLASGGLGSQTLLGRRREELTSQACSEDCAVTSVSFNDPRFGFFLPPAVTSDLFEKEGLRSRCHHTFTWMYLSLTENKENTVDGGGPANQRAARRLLPQAD